MGWLELHHRAVLLRDPRPEDTRDYVRWWSQEVAWQDWDAPWESQGPLTLQQAERHVLGLRKRVPTPIRTRLEICCNGGAHVGWVNRYTLRAGPEHVGVGIVIAEPAWWGRRIGTIALGLWCAYLFRHLKVPHLYCETWSGNQRMVRLAHRCGFAEHARQHGTLRVRGQVYDAVTLQAESKAALWPHDAVEAHREAPDD